MVALAPSSTYTTAELQRGVPPRTIEFLSVTFFAVMFTNPRISRPLTTWFARL